MEKKRRFGSHLSVHNQGYDVRVLLWMSSQKTGTEMIRKKFVSFDHMTRLMTLEKNPFCLVAVKTSNHIQKIRQESR
jgi:hypothetical protein